MRPFTLGTMYWINPNYSREEIAADLCRIKENNISLVRCFVWWEQAEEFEGCYDFSLSDELFAATEREGIDIMATIGFYPPMWLVKKLEQEGKNDPGRYPCLDRPEIKEPLRKYVRALVEHYRNSPSLKLWNVWNEPTVNSTPCRPVLEKFTTWLKETYPTIEALRTAWRDEHNVFTLLCPATYEDLTAEWLETAMELGTRGRNTTILFDYHRFTLWNLTDQIKWLVNEVKSIDPNHPSHANPCSISYNPVGSGNDHIALAQVLDTISCSCHLCDYQPGEQVSDYLGNYLYAVNQAYSWNRGQKPTWVGELQAGTSLSTRKITPDASTITFQLWQALAHGLEGTVFWEWQSWRAGLFQVGEYSLRNASDGAQTERSRAAAEFGRLYRENAEVFAEVERPAAQVAILYTLDTFIYKHMQEKADPYLAWHAHDANFALFGCQRALSWANLNVDFVNEDQVEAGLLKNYKVLYLPGVEVMRAGVAEQIREFVAAGGAVYADGRLAFLDAHLYLRQQVPGHGLSEVFGAREADFIGIGQGEVTLQTTGGETLRGQLLAQYLETTGGQAVAHYAGGQVAAVEHRFGLGRTRLVGAGLCRRLRDYEDADNFAYIPRLALECGVRPDFEGTPGLVGKRLKGQNREVLIVSNLSGRAMTGEISSKCTEVKCLQGGASSDGQFIRRDFAVGETAVFIL